MQDTIWKSDMQQGDTGSSYYHYDQSQFRNPNPISNPTDPQLNLASTPPISYYSSSDYSDHFSDRFHNSPLAYAQNLSSPSSHPSPEPYSFPHLVSQYDQNQTALGYNNFLNSRPISLSSPAPYASALYTEPGDSRNYINQFENLQGYNRTGTSDFGLNYDYGGYRNGSLVGGANSHKEEKVEPYGARDSGSEFSGRLIFDDYGRPIRYTDENEQNEFGPLSKQDKEIPVKTQQDAKEDGMQKFHVRLLSEGGGQNDMDVLCLIGLDGIRMLDSETNRTLRIYPFETLTNWEVLDSNIFAFWAKSSNEMESRCIRLKSNNYTITSILDTVTASAIQLKEMGGRNKPSDSHNASEQFIEKKKGFATWMNLMKPGNEEKDHWVPDEAVAKCTACQTDFGAVVRKHHCRNCGNIFCDKCTQGRIALTGDEHDQLVRVCDQCMAEVTQRLVNTNEGADRVAALKSHENLAKQLKEEMDKNQKISTGLRSDRSGVRETKEVACPTCTVHLQVDVPAFGSKTIECSVCQHPFLVCADIN